MTRKTQSDRNRASTLLAAVSALAVSVGMAVAADNQAVGDGSVHDQTQGASNQHKANATFLKLDSKQGKYKGESNQYKEHSMQHKGTTHNLNPQPLPPG
ncbi:MAG: hypothetical protein KGJ78_12545 [Alphaproteobacteria bacterium]|nr:hypothetical protein [Alphaproteobacteria bacterium]